jgi:hypothetical protein
MFVILSWPVTIACVTYDGYTTVWLTPKLNFEPSQLSSAICTYSCAEMPKLLTYLPKAYG